VAGSVRASAELFGPISRVLHSLVTVKTQSKVASLDHPALSAVLGRGTVSWLGSHGLLCWDGMMAEWWTCPSDGDLDQPLSSEAIFPMEQGHFDPIERAHFMERGHFSYGARSFCCVFL